MLNPVGTPTEVVEPHPALIEKWQREIRSQLNVLLAEGAALSRWLQNYHANRTSHSKVDVLDSTFEIQLNFTALLADEAVDRIHQYGTCALQTLEALIQERMSETGETCPDARTRAATLLTHHTTIRRCLCDDLKVMGEKSGNAAALELLTRLVQYMNMVYILRMCLDVETTVNA